MIQFSFLKSRPYDVVGRGAGRSRLCLQGMWTKMSLSRPVWATCYLISLQSSSAFANGDRLAARNLKLGIEILQGSPTIARGGRDLER